MLLTLLLLCLAELIGVVVAATPGTVIDLSPGVYAGYAYAVTEVCWPDMARVTLVVGEPPGTVTLGYTNKRDVDVVIAFGRVKAFSDGDFSRYVGLGICFYIDAHHYYPREALLQMTGPKPTHVPICLCRTQLVLFNDARREPGGNQFIHLGCAILLTKNIDSEKRTLAPAATVKPKAEKVGFENGAQLKFTKLEHS
ncbi:hypothetical protein FOZ61_002243 [Perkinsus olseni]|uniref:Uncharacterized protein n=1 Tax=Perkinsus olseni TaxID=32597 RepID=A0A7J6LTX0_PEROL|nr:hypothetical protein FOZ61_002243 [Perkinsus olseni]